MYVAFVIIVVSFVAALLTEGASWYLIYRKEDYQRLKKTIETLQSKVDKLKDAAPPSLLSTADSSTTSTTSKSKKPTKDEKKLTMLTGDLKKKQQLLTGQRFKSTVITTVVLIGLYQVLSRSVGSDVAVARLPFEPFPIVRGLSHRGLEGEDWYACSFGLVYALCQMAIRANVTRFFGFVPRDESGLSSFMPTEDEENK